MIKVTQAKWLQNYQLALLFSDGYNGIMDFETVTKQTSTLTAPLKDISYFKSYFLELGALCWPNGLEFSGGSLYKKLEASGLLNKPQAS